MLRGIRLRWQTFVEMGVGERILALVVFAAIATVAVLLLIGAGIPLVKWTLDGGPAALADAIGTTCCVLIALPFAIFLLRGWMRPFR
jgi:hypothetical protein